MHIKAKDIRQSVISRLPSMASMPRSENHFVVFILCWSSRLTEVNISLRYGLFPRRPTGEKQSYCNRAPSIESDENTIFLPIRKGIKKKTRTWLESSTYMARMCIDSTLHAVFFYCCELISESINQLSLVALELWSCNLNPRAELRENTL